MSIEHYLPLITKFIKALTKHLQYTATIIWPLDTMVHIVDKKHDLSRTSNFIYTVLYMTNYSKKCHGQVL